MTADRCLARIFGIHQDTKPHCIAFVWQCIDLSVVHIRRVFDTIVSLEGGSWTAGEFHSDLHLNIFSS